MQDDLNLYLVLEYLPGGELFRMVKNKGNLKVSQATFYLAEIVLALEALHKRNIIYRDLKAENILLTQSGHVKLIDFGFSKQLKDIQKDRVMTNCGTRTYAAPEVMMGGKYNYKADIWSLGILICELVGGFTPFRSSSDLFC
jgi:protein kinase A